MYLITLFVLSTEETPPISIFFFFAGVLGFLLVLDVIKLTKKCPKCKTRGKVEELKKVISPPGWFTRGTSIHYRHCKKCGENFNGREFKQEGKKTVVRNVELENSKTLDLTNWIETFLDMGGTAKDFSKMADEIKSELKKKE